MKYQKDAMLDTSLSYIKTNATGLVVCTSDILTSGVPDYTLITGASKLTGVIDVSSTASSWTVADGDVSGRKLTVAAQADIPITATGTAEHICIVDSATTSVLYVTSCTAQSLTSGNNVSIPAWDMELRDPV
jgi:hypothetical protein